MDQNNHSESITNNHLPYFKMVNNLLGQRHKSKHLINKKKKKFITKKLRQHRQSSFLINFNQRISPLCSANRAQATFFIGILFVILFYLSSVIQIIGSENIAPRSRGIHHHKHARHQPSSAIISHFTNNNRHSKLVELNQIEANPPSLLPSIETDNIVNNNNNFKHRSQVPEQLPIVVSSSDNSYVSASPVEFSTTITSSSTPHNDRINNNHLSTSRNPSKESHHQQHLQRVRPPWRPKHRPVTHNRENNAFSSQTKTVERGQKIGLKRHQYDRNGYYVVDNDDDDDDDEDDEEEEGEGEEEEEDNKFFKYELGDRTLQTSGSDISTTATTTQRNGDQHTVQKSHNHNEDRVLRSKLTSRNQLDDENRVIPSDNSTKHMLRSRLSLRARYSIKPASIIKTRESLDSGATFINYTIVTNLKACLVECWITESCDTAIYQESPVDFNNHLPELNYDQRYHSSSLNSIMSSSSSSISNIIDDRDENQNDEELDDNDENESGMSNSKGETENSPTDSVLYESIIRKQPNGVGFFVCYLFECSKPDGFKCQFSAHNYYVSAIKRHILANSVATSHETQRPSSQPIIPLGLSVVTNEKSHYSHITNGINHHRFDSKKPWHDSHIASIRIGQEEYEDFGARGLNSAIIAIMIGVGATGMLIMIVGHKMKSIRSRLAHKSRRRSLVPDTDFLINTIPD